MRNWMGAVGMVLLLAISSGDASAAAKCKDAKGKFIKCPPAAAAPKAPCKDAKGKFIKCAAAPAASTPMSSAAPMSMAAPMGMASAKPKNNHCRDIKTKKFAKCGTPNTEPVPMKAM